MPSWNGLRHNNRSQTQHLDSPQDQRPPSGHIQQAQPLTGSASASAPEDKGYNPRLQPQPYSDAHNDPEDRYIQTPIDGPSGINHYDPGELSAATDSHRYSKLFHHEQHSQQFQQQQQEFDFDQQSLNFPSQSAGLPASQIRRNHTVTASTSSVPSVEAPKKSKKSKKNFFGFGSKSQKVPKTDSQHQSQGFLHRSASKKQSSKPELRMQQNSIDRLQQGWHQSEGSSSGTLPSHAEKNSDDFDPYQIRDDDSDQQQQRYDTRQDPRQGLSVRVVDDSQSQLQHYQQFQDQQHLQSPAGYSPQQQQQYQQFSQHGTPITPDQSREQEYNSQQMPSQQQNQYQQQQNLNYGGQPPSAYRQQNPEVVSQLSHESPLDQPEERPGSVRSEQGYNQYPSRKTSIAGVSSQPQNLQQLQQQQQQQQQPGNMAPSQASAAQGRKSTEVNKSLQPGDTRGQPPAYSQGQSQFQPPPGPPSQAVNLQHPLPAIPGQAQQPPGYRNSRLNPEVSGMSEGGRSTPPLPTAPANDQEMSEYQKLIIKYKKVKGLYFEKSNQVEALQNTLANQRLSQSRTSLDDSEYITRFQRLDGAIKEVAFSIRKDWSFLPPWLTPVVNPDAMRVGTKEMTAVGRAVITRWLYEEIWGKCFHPCLEQPLREELKRIENQVRMFSPPPASAADIESQSAKIVQWRLTTMEGLQYRLNGQIAHQAKADYIQMAVGNLTAHLLQFLSEDAAMNIQGNATSIVELAVGIASHLPLESRDIVITYAMPKDMVQSWMKVEQGQSLLPPLEHYFSETSQEGESSKKEEMAEKSDKGKKLKSKNGKNQKDQGPAPEQLQELERKKAEAANRIRFAGFVGVEVKGRQWLFQPPVWTIA